MSVKITKQSHNDLSAGRVSMPCECGEPITITARSPESILSATFCQKCDRQYWIRWSEGVIRQGKIDGDPASDTWKENT